MSEEKFYQMVWNKYLPAIALKIKGAVKKNELQQLGMDKIDFEKASPRRNSKFQFNLEMKQGKIMMAKNVTPVGRDFARALNEYEITKELIEKGNFIFTLDTKFILSINVNKGQ